MPRPSGLPVIPDHEAQVITDTAIVDARGRINLLPRWRSRVPWLTGSSSDKAALMIFVEEGLISIRDWEEYGPQIRERYLQAARSTEPDRGEILRLIQDRYQRLIVPAAERASLGTTALLHLGLPIDRSQGASVHVCVSSASIDLLSVALRTARLVEGHSYLHGLP
jgi:hypothetical protein